MVALTEKARETLQRLVANAEPGTNGLRIMVETGGCSGLQYRLGLEKAACDGDRVYEIGPVKVYVDARSLPIVDGLHVDFVEGVEASGFVFDNPNARDMCSCGKSFSG
ncbi:MAG: HesB/IscA family protein [Rhodospirillales bacterium]